jgi:endonuclease I
MKRYRLLRTLFLSALLLMLVSGSDGQIPPGYYDSAMGLSGDSLRLALHQIIKNHQAQTYASLWAHFQRTDRKPGGVVWDIYSDIPGGTPAYTYTFVTNQCGNYSAEGDCYNREHSVPASWFGSAQPVYTDLFHLYPTDGYVNGKRSNYPYGEVMTTSWTSTNGSRLGTMNQYGYQGIVFEPIDSFKGDLARTYLYMAVRYLDVMAGWSSAMFSGDSLSGWTRQLLLAWHALDPVSAKEIARNDSIYLIQGNRNPFIDHPGWVQTIWDTPDGVFSHHADHHRITSSMQGSILHIHNPGGVKYALRVYSVAGSLLLESEGHQNQNHHFVPGGQRMVVVEIRSREAVSVKKYWRN